jgi:hypothetical protein
MEERMLRVFENMVLRRIFGPKRDEEMGGYRKLHSEDRCDLYSLPSIIRMIKPRRMNCTGHLACKSLAGKPAGRRLLGRPRC